MTDFLTLPLEQLAQQFGTPFYLYSQQQIATNYTQLEQAFCSQYPHFRIHYAVKANSNFHLIHLLQQLGAGADCSSIIEVQMAQKGLIPNEKIIYSGNYESASELSFAVANNLTLNLDDINSFQRLLTLGQLPPLISFRINPGIGRGSHEAIVTGGTDAKFGIPYEKAAGAYEQALAAGIRRFGIHMMTGSNNLEPYHFAEVVEKLMAIAGDIFARLQIVPEFIDIGGGFGVPYHPDDTSLDLVTTARLISEKLREKLDYNQLPPPLLIIEPGRFLLANAGVLVGRVTNIKESYRRFVGIDAGMNTLLRPALYQAYHQLSVYPQRPGKKVLANICGQICENADIFAKDYWLDPVAVGDLMVIHTAGAYGMSMSSNYNGRPRPAEILLTQQGEYRLIRRRENLADLLSQIPPLS